MDFETYEKTEKIFIEKPENGTDYFKSDLKKYEQTNCVLLKHPFGLIPWPTIVHHKFKTFSPFVDADFQLLQNVVR